MGEELTAAEAHAEDLANRAPSLVIVAERWISIAIAILLTIAAVLALYTAGERLVSGVFSRGPDAQMIVLVVDHLLLVLMLVEILHTVRQSIESRELQAEPFLIVGLIATVRRILLVTLESSETGISPKDGTQNFDHSMTELVVLAGLTLVLVVSIYIARRSREAKSR